MKNKQIRVCSRCKCEVVFDEDLVTNGYEDESYNYYCVCLVHDEDLDLWETELVSEKDVVKFVTDEDKDYYRKHGYLPISKFEEVEI